MRKFLLIIVVLLAIGAGAVVYNRNGDSPDPGDSRSTGGTYQPGGRGSGTGIRPPMPVEFADASRGAVAEQILLVGNLIGEATVLVVPRVNGRLQSVTVKLADPVRRGQVIARVEDREIQEQVRQAEASFQVAQASIRQRDADLKLASTNLDRSRSLYERQLLPQQTFDDTQARYEAALAQTDLARAQFEQAKARLDELKITLSNTLIVSPVDGFVGKRFLDPGAFASTNAPVASVVDISSVRMVANLVERDVRRVPAGTKAAVEVDAFPGEKFAGRVSRIAPVFDPATRTAEMEIQVPNPGFRLKPGMYARVELTVDTKPDALTIPRAALIAIEGKNGVFVAVQPDAAEPAATSSTGQPPAMTARFLPVEVGIRDGERIEITAGLKEGARVITTGSGALKDGDHVVAAAGQRQSGRGREGSGRAGSGQERAR
jgi:RND family efflux transporter MFP subunit